MGDDMRYHKRSTLTLLIATLLIFISCSSQTTTDWRKDLNSVYKWSIYKLKKVSGQKVNTSLMKSITDKFDRLLQASIKMEQTKVSDGLNERNVTSTPNFEKLLSKNKTLRKQFLAACKKIETIKTTDVIFKKSYATMINKELEMWSNRK